LQRLLRSADFQWTAQCADDWRKPWPGFIHTRYHAKAAREERASCFLILRKI
jgi:tRNA (guanine-N7-)-methyltransferase